MQINLGRSKVKRVAIHFVQEGEKVNKTITRQDSLEDACDWEMQVDLGGKLVVPQEIASTNLRPDMVLTSWSSLFHRADWEDLVVEAYERKKVRYVELGAEAEHRGWEIRICPVELGCRGFVKSVVSLLRELGVSGQSVRKIVKEMSDEAVRSSQWIWIRRSNSSWGPSRESI